MPNKGIAIISDIHSNIDALEAVLDDISNLGIDEIICLGDLIGYGPNPREIIQKAHNWRFCLRGNHEDALLFIAYDFNPDAAKVIDWTRAELNSPQYTRDENYTFWNFLGGLPDIKEDGDIMYVHASPRHHTKEYIMPFDIQNEEMMEEIFSMVKRLCFVGHTHIPGIFTEDFKFFSLNAFAHNKVKLPSDKKFVINSGSIGQPRDMDTRASYTIFDGETVEFRRVTYDYKKTIAKIRTIKEIPTRFADRLELGR